jgi:hypothetical protein
MSLTDREREFLAVFVHVATTDPFKGPATDELHRRDIYYSDLPHLLEAYYHESHGPVSNSDVLPTCPWNDREAAIRRDSEIAASQVVATPFISPSPTPDGHPTRN